MNKGQKVALRHAANAIDGTRPVGGVVLGKNTGEQYATEDAKGRNFAVTYLARRGGTSVTDLGLVKLFVQKHYGLTEAQVARLESTAASTHNLKQRSERVARFLRRVVAQPGYAGRRLTAPVFVI